MWFFKCPTVVFGEDALEELLSLKGKRAFIVTDKNVVKLGLTSKAVSLLKEVGLELTIFDKVEPDPSFETCIAGAKAMEQQNPEWIIAIGGGSVLDAAKAMWVLYERPDMKLDEIFPDVEIGLRKKARLVTIPTTSGTGADATWAIVITDQQVERKICLASRELIADISIVDPSLCTGMPPKLTAMTGVDVIAHALEAYTCTWQNDFSDGLAIKALQVAIEYLPRAVENGEDLQAREHMHNAATMAGIAFGNSNIAGIHSMSHSFGAVFHTPHGICCGLFLPYVVEYNRDAAQSRYQDVCEFLKISIRPDENPGMVLGTFLRTFITELGLPTKIADINISHQEFTEKLSKLVESANEDVGTLINPRDLESEDFKRLFQYAFEGKRVDF